MSIVEFEQFKIAKLIQFRDQYRFAGKPRDQLEVETLAFEARLDAVRNIVQQPQLEVDNLA